MKYYQCELTRASTYGTLKQVAWIEERGAHVGKNVEVKDGSGRWDVVAVYPQAMDAKALSEFQQNSRNFKAKTDY